MPLITATTRPVLSSARTVATAILGVAPFCEARFARTELRPRLTVLIGPAPPSTSNPSPALICRVWNSPNHQQQFGSSPPAAVKSVAESEPEPPRTALAAAARRPSAFAGVN
ncbi:hypothetical protein NL676_005400 [Syzygium grande]|nr:hypothetical protein NL676_005400 [Syzygium grande]